MAALLRLIEACLLSAMGAFMAILSQSDIYWQFLNPKYSWLTLTTGIVLVCIGFACLLNTRRQYKLSEFSGIVIFLFVAWTAIVSFEHMADADFGGSGLTGEYMPEQEASVEFDGIDYVKINVAELLLGEQEGTVLAGQPYAVQGAVMRRPELDKAGYIALGRLHITCCFADSVGIITLIKVANPETYTHGSWVQVAGVVEEGVPFPGESIILDGALTVVRSEGFSLRAVEINEQPVEGLPFIFDIRISAPFAY